MTTASFSLTPDAAIPAQRVSFGTSGHRGCAFATSFNEAHVLAIIEAICLYRKHAGIDGLLFPGIDTHAVSHAAFATVIEVHATNGIDMAAITFASVRIGTEAICKRHAETFGSKAQRELLQADGRALIEAVFARA